MIAPDEFIGLAEETGLIVSIGDWVSTTGLFGGVQMARQYWSSRQPVADSVSNKSLVPTVLSSIAAAGLSPYRLELEITEAVLLQNNQETISVLHQLRGLGVRIAMDDFGTGYSSLSYLRSFPFDKIKIDRSFVRDLALRKDSIAIIRAVSALGKDLGMITTAEGVETMEQLAQVHAEGCTEVQGYLFSAPCPTSELPKLLSTLNNVKVAAHVISFPSREKASNRRN